MTQDECWQKCYQEIYTLIKKRVPSNDETLFPENDNGFHNSRQIAHIPANRIHGITGTKPSARNDSLVTDLKSQLGYSQDPGRGPLLAGQQEHTDKLGAGE